MEFLCIMIKKFKFASIMRHKRKEDLFEIYNIYGKVKSKNNILCFMEYVLYILFICVYIIYICFIFG